MMIDALKSQLGSSMNSVRRFLERPITLRQGHLALGAPARSVRAPAREAQREHARRMRRELYRLMELHPDSRQLMRHLDLLERTLRRQGMAGVEALPARVVATALTQLERLVGDWSAEGLAELRSHLAVIVKRRAVLAARAAASLLSDAAMPQATDVTEVGDDDLAMFRDMERSWAGRMPEPVSAKSPSAA
jgi:hypothetical protein